MTIVEDPYHALMTITPRPDTIFTHGKGSWLYDQQGKSYLDFIQGWAVNSLGHCHESVVQAITQQAEKLIHPSPAFYNEPMLALAKLLVAQSCFDQVFFTNSGAEANEGAIKLARKWGRKFKNGAYEIITFTHSFHGRTLATMSASGKPGWDTLYAPQVPGFPKAQLNDMASVEQQCHDKTVAVMLEPIQGEGGVIAATADFMQALRAFTQQRRLLLIVDEVQSGCGRTGTLFAYEQANITPDIMTLGKGIGGGVPLAALLCRDAVACFETGDQGGTYNGNPLMTAVGLAVLKQLTAPGFLAQVCASGAYLQAGLRALATERGFTGERGVGLLRALCLGQDSAATIVEHARLLKPKGLLLNAVRADTLRFMPALNVTPAEIDEMLTLLRSVLDTLGYVRCTPT